MFDLITILILTIKVYRYMESVTMNCPECGSNHVVKAGIQVQKNKRKQRYLCKQCGRIILGEVLSE
jgi:transposase-like protein